MSKKPLTTEQRFANSQKQLKRVNSANFQKVAKRPAKNTTLNIDSTKNVSHGISGRSIISLVFILILFISAIRVVGGHSPISLSSFLSQVAGAPSIPTGWIGNIDTNLGNIFPTGLKWLGKFFDFFVDGVSFALYFSVMVVNIIPYLFYFLKWLLL